MSSSEHRIQSAEPYLQKSHDQMTAANGFDITQLVMQRTEPALEVAGPTECRGKTGLAAYPVWQGLPPVPLYVGSRRGATPRHRSKKIDLQLNACQLPFLDSSLGIIATSALPEFDIGGPGISSARELHRAFMAEAKRCLVPDGLLVIAGIEAARAWWNAQILGMTVLQMLRPVSDPTRQHVIFLNREHASDQQYNAFAVPTRS